MTDKHIPDWAGEQCDLFPDDDDVMKAVRHAPAGGITIGGEFFHGGQFIPDEAYSRGTDEEKAVLDGELSVNEDNEEDDFEDDEEWDGYIDASKVEFIAPSGDELGDFYEWSSKGDLVQMTVDLESGIFTTPQGDDVEVYRAIVKDQNGKNVEETEWFSSESEAKSEAIKLLNEGQSQNPNPEDSDINDDEVDEGSGPTIGEYINSEGGLVGVDLRTGTFTFAGKEYEAFKWIAIDENGDVVDQGDWTLNEESAWDDGQSHIDDNGQEPEQVSKELSLRDIDLDEINDELPDNTRPELAQDTQIYLNNYSWGYDGPMNKALRNTWEPPPGDFGGNEEGKPDKDGPEMYAAIRDAMASSSPFGPPPITVMRGLGSMPAEAVERMVSAAEHCQEKGLAMTMGGFVSTTTNSDVQSTFDGPIRFKIDAIHGLDMKPYSHFKSENELLLNHGCQYRVKDVLRGREYHTIHLEQITDGTELPPPDMIPLDGRERELKAMRNNSNKQEPKPQEPRRNRMQGDEDEANSWLKAFEHAKAKDETKKDNSDE